MNSVMFLCACLLLMAVVPSSEAYPDRVPIVEVEGVCTSMDPSGHGAVAQNVASPFEIITSQDCYKVGQTVQVVVKALDGNSAEIEGLFVQARKTDGTTNTYGTFDTDSNTDLSILNCAGSNANSAVGHNKKIKKGSKSMNWTPPSGLTGPIKFRATVVKEKPEFWVGLESSELTLKDDCVVGHRIGAGSTLKATPYCLAFVLVSFVMTIFAQ